MRLVHDPEDDLRIAFEAKSPFIVERRPLSLGCGCRIRRIADNAATCRLVRRVVVPIVVMRIQESVSAFGVCDVIDGVLVFGEVRLVELGA